MIADALDTDVFAIEEETCIHIELDCADAKDGLITIADYAVDGMAVLFDSSNGYIKIGPLQIPKLWVVDAQRHRTAVARAGSDGRRYRNRRRNRLTDFLPVYAFI